ncbi:MAG: TolC family protein, partial [Pseudanabaenales cyanobacterium]|nr:TolC family protein [Pseudanabaenales cyanobacterium]
MQNYFHCSSSMLLTLLSMGAAIALIPASALAMPAEPKELAELFDAVPIPSTLSAQDDFASGALSIVHAPQKTSRAFSREVEFDSLVQGILPASDRNTIAAHVRETLISREPLTKASGIPENFDASFNPLWSPPQLLVNELAQVVPTNDWRGNAVIPFNPTPRLSKSAIETPSSDYFELNANFSVFLAQLPAQLTVNELAQAAPTDEVNEDRLPSFIDPEPPPNELTVEEGAAPEYLNPDPNPLLFPTQPEEVDIIGAQPITLEQAIELAYRNNEDLQVALLQLDQSLSALRQAQAALFPTLNLTSDLTAQENTATSTVAASDRDVDIDFNGRLRLSYDVFTSGARSGNIGAAERQVRFNELQVEVIQENLRLDTSNDYYDLQNAVEQIRINQAFLEEAEQNLRDTSLREEVGVGTRFDVLRAEVQVADARQDLVQAQSNKEIAQRA